MKFFILAIIAVTSFSLSNAQTFPPAPRVVNVEGEAERKVAPDRAIVQLGVETEGTNATEVKADNDKRMRLILAALKKIGIPDTDIQTSVLQLNPQYNWDPNGKREFLKYIMSNKISVLIKDLKKVQDVISTSVEQGGNTLNDVAFSVSNNQALKDSLRIEAAKNAKRKANDLAVAVGSKLGKPLSISEQSSYQPPYPMYAMKSAEGNADNTPTISAGEIVIRVTVSASFELE